ncbi:MAG: COX15/CtaA family protein [Cyclobacteriaceae bacterium]
MSTLVAVYVLILVGGIVRSTGSGMGCPDWPKCFGAYVPPTSVSELPTNYKEIYAQARERKNQRFAKLLASIGMQSTANEILSDKRILEEEDFNARKTWTEYINRLVGVIIGLFIIALVIAGFRARKDQAIFFTGSLAILAVVLFQGWLGSIVVSTNLTPWTITIHMVLAIVLIWLLLWLRQRSGGMAVELQGADKWLLWSSLAVALIQLFLGTRVREEVDAIARSLPREQWIDGLGIRFLIHRSFSWLLLIVVGWTGWKMRKIAPVQSLGTGILVVLLLSLLTGTGMAYAGMPAFLQPLHLLLSTLLIGWVSAILLKGGTKQVVAG